ncbi:MAG TPA: hypothetical protein VNS19_15460 [Acidimicrobiales bacterium]|nr:hypothetical protein [Acidimicrobiales bacterium]
MEGEVALSAMGIGCPVALVLDRLRGGVGGGWQAQGMVAANHERSA